jgi:hypothetical protein
MRRASKVMVVHVEMWIEEPLRVRYMGLWMHFPHFHLQAQPLLRMRSRTCDHSRYADQAKADVVQHTGSASHWAGAGSNYLE